MVSHVSDAQRTKKIMGIDLGTTNSCVALPCEGEGLDAVRVITDGHGRATVPSVVYKGADGEVLVGHRAKQKLGATPMPIAFIKRYMGKDHQVRLGSDEFSPEQVSALILKHLAGLVKDDLGEEVTQAVITIPARFDLAGQQATVAAARLAGLEVLTTMPEPVAAALAYGLQDAADDLKIFCYDLGGGTFDATVMVKNADTGIEVLAFDGDEHLGGYNFDTAFSEWLWAHLARSYALVFDRNSPEDQVRFQKLMRIAEQTKIALSKDFETEVSEKPVFEDQAGEPVDLDMLVKRCDYVALIQPLIERTIEISRRAIAKAGLRPEQLDRVIMVGGSSRLPIAKELLESALGRPAELVDPDKIVARGAAVKAGTMVGASTAGLEFRVPLPARCALSAFDVIARVTLAGAADAAVSLERSDGRSWDTRTDAEGCFSFTGVDLIEGEANEFTLRVGAPQAPLLVHPFEVTHDPQAASQHLDTNFITSEIGLLLATGPLAIFREGDKIPAHKVVEIGTRHDDQTFAKFDVYHGHHTLGEVSISQLPPGTPAGARILVNVRLDDALQLGGDATLVKSGQSVEFRFEIPRPKLPDEKELRLRLDDLRADFDDALQGIGDNAQRMKCFGEGQRQMREISGALAQQQFDQPRAARLVDELSMFVSNMSQIEVLSPSWEEFFTRLEGARRQAKEAEVQFAKARKAGFSAALDGIEVYGRQAFDGKNQEVWKEANAQLDRVVQEIDAIVGEEERDAAWSKLSPEQRAELFRRHLERRLMEAQQRITSEARFRRHEPELQTLIREVNGMNPMDPDGAFDKGRKLSARIDELLNRLAFTDGQTVHVG